MAELTQATPVIAVSGASAMPAPTWHRLRVNDAEISVPENLELGSSVEVELSGLTLGEQDAFDSIIAAFQTNLDSRKSAEEDTRAVVIAAQDKAPASDLDVPALSAYQKAAVLEEVAGDVAQAFTTGMGDDARAYLESAVDDRVVLLAEENQQGSAVVRLDGQPGCVNAAAIDVVALSGSKAHVTIVFDSPTEGTGVVGSVLRVFAGHCSNVTITTVQTLDTTWIGMDDSGFVLSDHASVNVVHRVLGAGESYTGLAADLRGDSSHIDTLTRYIAADTEKRDFNYSVKQRGRFTESNLDANGVLSGTSQKTLRGTIDFVHGCKGSVGNERETVLLADEGVENKTVPVILCDEDDVMGNHGATIGHVRPEQRFYLACRGLSDTAAEQLFSIAALEEAYLAHDDARQREGIARVAARYGVDAQDFNPEGEAC